MIYAELPTLAKRRHFAYISNHFRNIHLLPLSQTHVLSGSFIMPQGDDHDYSPLFVGGRQTLCVLTCFAMATFVELVQVS